MKKVKKTKSFKNVTLFPKCGNKSSPESNKVVSSQYTLLTFFPKNIVQQFRRLINFFFLVLSVFMFTVNIPVNPIPYVAAFIFVLTVTAVRQAYEDWQRHKADKKINLKPITILKEDGGDEVVPAEKLRSGDIVKIKGDDAVPCDVVLIGSLGLDECAYPYCQITTANLDGETNLKMRYAPQGLEKYEGDDAQLVKMLKKSAATFSCEPPTASLSKFEGYLHLDESNDKGKNLSMDNVLLRGSTIKHCSMALGVAIYVGEDTRLSMNSKTPKNVKLSRVEKTVNKIVLATFGIFAAMVLTATGFYSYYKATQDFEKAWFIPYEDKSELELHLETFFSYIALLCFMIPVSMIVSVEVTKMGSRSFFSWDEEIKCHKTNTPAVSNTSELNDELGQIEYLLTDKTGTLTENNLSFLYCSISGTRYKYFQPPGLLVREEKGRRISTISACTENKDLEGISQNNLHLFPDANHFFHVMALCHSVRTIGTPKNVHEVVYYAESLDEEVLVKTAQSFNVTFMGISCNKEVEDNILLTANDGNVTFRRHAILEFDHDRKCMSIIVEMDDGKIYVISKGSDSSILPKCTNKKLVKSTGEDVYDFAKLGLRTLVFAEKEISRSELEAFKKEKAQNENDPKGLRKLYDQMETDMQLLGATGVDDELQEGVPETLVALRKASIKIWMLTGDKLETAVNVAILSGMIPLQSGQDEFSEAFKISECTEQDKMTEDLSKIKNSVEDLRSKGQDTWPLIMDGVSFGTALNFCPQLLSEVLTIVSHIVFCRMAPIQKAQVAKLLKDRPEKFLTAAVGDGGNDVAMILEANIGIGIIGKEGRQAARASDFALARFSFLRKVILVHGVWHYHRMCTIVSFFFYRGVIFAALIYLYGFFHGFSSRTVYDSTFATLFTLLFSSTPIVSLALIDQYIPKNVLLQNPSLYKSITKNNFFRLSNMLHWSFITLWHSLIIFFVPLFFWKNFNTENDWGSFSLFVCSVAILVANSKVLIESRLWTLPLMATECFSYIASYTFYAIYCEVGTSTRSPIKFSYHKLLQLPEFYYALLISLVISIFPDIIRNIITNIKQTKQLVVVES